MSREPTPAELIARYLDSVEGLTASLQMCLEVGAYDTLREGLAILRRGVKEIRAHLPVGA